MTVRTASQNMLKLNKKSIANYILSIGTSALLIAAFTFTSLAHLFRAGYVNNDVF